MTRWGHQYKNAINRVNNLIQRTCNDENFLYMDQDDITGAHVAGDGIHPNFYGSTILKFNILSVFRSFNPYLTNFDDDYERALF